MALKPSTAPRRPAAGKSGSGQRDRGEHGRHAFANWTSGYRKPVTVRPRIARAKVIPPYIIARLTYNRRL
jgi:hypothetical protein